MNVYDFDETIFHPDSSFCFFCYCLRHRTLAVSKCIPSAVFQFVNYLLHGGKDAKELKEALFSFLNRIDNVEYLVDSFWKEHSGQIADWYLEQKREDDVIISASPEFLLHPVAELLGVDLIATLMNPYNGKIKGKNCHDREKVRRFRERYSDAQIDEFYSDSFVDEPMARIAGKAFLVRGSKRTAWPF